MGKLAAAWADAENAQWSKMKPWEAAGKREAAEKRNRDEKLNQSAWEKMQETSCIQGHELDEDPSDETAKQHAAREDAVEAATEEEAAEAAPVDASAPPADCWTFDLYLGFSEWHLSCTRATLDEPFDTVIVQPFLDHVSSEHGLGLSISDMEKVLAGPGGFVRSHPVADLSATVGTILLAVAEERASVTASAAAQREAEVREAAVRHDAGGSGIDAAASKKLAAAAAVSEGTDERTVRIDLLPRVRRKVKIVCAVPGHKWQFQVDVDAASVHEALLDCVLDGFLGSLSEAADTPLSLIDVERLVIEGVTFDGSQPACEVLPRAGRTVLDVFLTPSTAATVATRAPKTQPADAAPTDQRAKLHPARRDTMTTEPGCSTPSPQAPSASSSTLQPARPIDTSPEPETSNQRDPLRSPDLISRSAHSL